MVKTRTFLYLLVSSRGGLLSVKIKCWLLNMLVNYIIFWFQIDYVEFEMHAAGRSNMQYFDLLIRLKTEQEYLFRNIQRNEYHNLYDYIRSVRHLSVLYLFPGIRFVIWYAVYLFVCWLLDGGLLCCRYRVVLAQNI